MIEPHQRAEPSVAGGFFAVTSLMAALGVASCCALPVLLTGMGLGTVLVGRIGVVTLPYRSILIGIGLVSLTAGSWTLWRQYRSTRDCDRFCARSWLRYVTLAGLLLAAVILLWGASYG